MTAAVRTFSNPNGRSARSARLCTHSMAITQTNRAKITMKARPSTYAMSLSFETAVLSHVP